MKRIRITTYHQTDELYDIIEMDYRILKNKRLGAQIDFWIQVQLASAERGNSRIVLELFEPKSN